MTAAQSLQRAYLRIHQALYEGSGGLVGHRLAGTPSLLLTTVGRRSGRPRTAALIYARDAADLVLVASNHGLDRPPALHGYRNHGTTVVRFALTVFEPAAGAEARR